MTPASHNDGLTPASHNDGAGEIRTTDAPSHPPSPAQPSTAPDPRQDQDPGRVQKADWTGLGWTRLGHGSGTVTKSDRQTDSQTETTVLRRSTTVPLCPLRSNHHAPVSAPLLSSPMACRVLPSLCSPLASTPLPVPRFSPQAEVRFGGQDQRRPGLTGPLGGVTGRAVPGAAPPCWFTPA